MPRTRDAEQLDVVKGEGFDSHPIIDSLPRIISKRFKKDDKAGPAFVVEGTGKSALENMVGAFNSEPPRYVPANEENSLVFYTRFGGHYVHIETVERLGQTIVVTYRFVTHFTANSTFHFALIPLSKLPAGTYKVEVKQSPPIDEAGRQVTLDRDLSWIVCQGGTFYVKGKP